LNIVDTAVRWRAVHSTGAVTRLCGGALQALRDIRRVVAALKRLRPDVLHLCTSGEFSVFKDTVILRAARRRGVRSILHYHRGHLPEVVACRGWRWNWSRVAMASADRTILLDRASLAVVGVAAPEIRSALIPNAIDMAALDADIPSPNEAKPCAVGHMRIVYVGHVEAAKGLRELVAACAALRREVTLDVVGPAEVDFRAELERSAALANPSFTMRFHGVLGHMRALCYIRAADVFVLPSHSEGFSLSLLEAMACGVPIVATRVGAAPEMLEGEGGDCRGVIVPPRDVGQLAAALTGVLDQPMAARAMGARARARARELYDVHAVFRQLVEMWQSLMQNRLGA